MSILAVVGTRDMELNETNYKMIEAKILAWEEELGFTFTTIVSGGAAGVDSLGILFALRHARLQVEYLPDYDKYRGSMRRIAPLERNTKIVNHSEYMIAFPKGRSPGTRDSIKKAKKANLKLLVCEL